MPHFFGIFHQTRGGEEEKNIYVYKTFGMIVCHESDIKIHTHMRHSKKKGEQESHLPCTAKMAVVMDSSQI